MSYPELVILYADESTWSGNLEHFIEAPKKPVCLFKIKFPKHCFYLRNYDFYGVRKAKDYIELAGQAPYVERTVYERIYKDGRQQRSVAPNTANLDAFTLWYGKWQDDDVYERCSENAQWL